MTSHRHQTPRTIWNTSEPEEWWNARVERLIKNRKRPKEGILLGQEVEGRTPYYLPMDALRIHVYVIGAPGYGKSKLLHAILENDFQQGTGFGVIDPHGDLVNDVLGTLACYHHQTEDDSIFDRVVHFDLTNPTHTLTFNPLEQQPGVSSTEQAQELVSCFKSIWADSWGVRMEELMRNSFIALNEAELTLAQLNQFLIEDDFRDQVLARCSHPIAKHYFEERFPQSAGARMSYINPVTNKVDAFMSDERVRHMLSFPKSSFNLREIMDSGKILLVTLNSGRLPGSSNLVGSLLLAKIKLAAFSRADTRVADRRPFHLCIDEFQTFADADSMATILTETRKFGLSLVLAHQTMQQIPLALRSQVLTSADIQVYFKLNRQDAQVCAKEAFEYSGFSVKQETVLQSGELRDSYWSLGEEWERNISKLQRAQERQCHVYHRKAGELTLIGTKFMRDPWDILQMEPDEYEQYRATLPFGHKYVVSRKDIEAATTGGGRAQTARG